MDCDGPEREKERERDRTSHPMKSRAQEHRNPVSIANSLDPNSIRSSKSIDPSTSNVVPGVRFSSVGIEGGGGGWRVATLVAHHRRAHHAPISQDGWPRGCH